jgi:uncharacterized protein (TIGR02594 family)
VNTTALEVARTYLGTQEIEGREHNPSIVAMLQQVAPWATADEVPWCSGFVYEVALRLGLSRPTKLAARARSWLTVGTEIELFEARPANDIVVLRGTSHAGPEVLDAAGHVGFFVARLPGQVEILGGNQQDSVSIARFHQADILGVRRLA